MLTVIVSLLLFMLQKLIHELGHFIIARRAGIVVEEVGVGYGPQAAKIWQSTETLYTLNWFPFGGFIKMLGEKDPSTPGSFASKSKFTRFLVLIIGPLLNLIMLGIFLFPGIMCFTLFFGCWGCYIQLI